jgi:hypothetical protein
MSAYDPAASSVRLSHCLLLFCFWLLCHPCILYCRIYSSYDEFNVFEGLFMLLCHCTCTKIGNLTGAHEKEVAYLLEFG